MNDYRKRSFGAVVVIGLLMLLRATFIDLGLVAAAGALPSSGQQNVAEAPVAQSSDNGQVIFEQKCQACHTIGGGPLVGPDLKGVTELRDREWLARWIFEPDKMLAEGDSIAVGLLQEFNNIPMTPLGLSEADVEDVLVYLENSSGGAVAPAAVPLPQGHAERGEALFTGAVKLENGAPACIGCHSTTGVGAMGGGTLGPDLTNVISQERFGEAGLASTLETLPFPTMQGVFADKPLTLDELADLLAYFGQTNQTEAESVGFISFVGLALVSFLVLLLFSQLIWHKRLKAVHKPLLGGAK